MVPQVGLRGTRVVDRTCLFGFIFQFLGAALHSGAYLLGAALNGAAGFFSAALHHSARLFGSTLHGTAAFAGHVASSVFGVIQSCANVGFAGFGGGFHGAVVAYFYFSFGSSRRYVLSVGSG